MSPVSFFKRLLAPKPQDTRSPSHVKAAETRKAVSTAQKRAVADRIRREMNLPPITWPDRGLQRGRG